MEEKEEMETWEEITECHCNQAYRLCRRPTSSVPERIQQNIPAAVITAAVVLDC